MTIQTTAMKNALATAYGVNATHGALYSTAGTGVAGTEISGGAPAYARKALVWGAPVNGVITATAVFDIPSGVTLLGSGVHTALTAGTYLDGGGVSSQPFNSQGTYTETFTYTQT
jgi:hypothetical protein